MYGAVHEIEMDWDDRPRRGLPAWSLSAGLHLVLIVLIGVLPAGPVRDADAIQDRPAGIALVDRADDDVEYFSGDTDDGSAALQAESADAPAANESSAEALSEFAATNDVLPGAEQLAAGAALELPTLDGITGASGGGLPSAAGLTQGGARQSGVSGGQANTQVFGARGEGDKFVYVFDRSASMQGFRGRPMAAARRQLLTSLQDLASVHQFQIVYYNDRTAVFNPLRPQPPSLMFATDENKRLAEQFVRSIEPAGATRHMEALRIALGLSPDVIFFLTDAAEPQLTRGELDEIRRRNRAETVIHTIEFGSGPQVSSDNFLVRLAAQNGGQHVYIDVASLEP